MNTDIKKAKKMLIIISVLLVVFLSNFFLFLLIQNVSIFLITVFVLSYVIIALSLKFDKLYKKINLSEINQKN